MLNKKHTFYSKATIVASLTLLSASVTAAVNKGPVKVKAPAQQSQAGQLQNVLSQQLTLVQDEQRYIVKFKQTGSAALRGEKNKLKKAPMRMPLTLHLIPWLPKISLKVRALKHTR